MLFWAIVVVATPLTVRWLSNWLDYASLIVAQTIKLSLDQAAECLTATGWVLFFEVLVLFLIVVGSVWLWRSVIKMPTPEQWQSLKGNGEQQGRMRCDKPIANKSEDKLHRSDYVAVLKLMIHNAERNTCAQYIGLYGAWGEGKTSVINMLKQSSDLWHFNFVDFSPWKQCESADYPELLFRGIAESLPGPRFLACRNRLVQFARMLQNTSGASSCGRIASNVAMCLNLISGKGIKECLIDELKRVARRIVVVIDDMDRLSPQEVFEVIRLIKANGDLPNITYLVSGDKDYLASSIGRIVGEGNDSKNVGRSYLEKIVQIEYPLPPVDKSVVREVLLAKAKEIPKRYISFFDWWPNEDMFEEVMPLVKNFRDVARVLNIFEEDVAIQVRKHGMRAGIDAHTGDMFALSVMKLKCQTFVVQLHRHFGEWAFASSSKYRSDRRGVDDSWLENKLLSFVPNDYKDTATAFLKKRMRMVCLTMHPSGEKRYVLGEVDSPSGLKEYRLHSRFAFDNYFSTKKNIVPVRRKLYRRMVSALKHGVWDDAFVREIVSKKAVWPLLYMLGVESLDHSEPWSVNLIASLASLSDAPISVKLRGENDFFDESPSEALFGVARAFMVRLNSRCRSARSILSQGLKIANSMRMRLLFLCEYLVLSKDEQEQEDLFPLADVALHLEAACKRAEEIELSGDMGSLGDWAFVRRLWAEVAWLSNDEGACLRFRNAQKDIYKDVGGLKSVMELFLRSDREDGRIRVLDLLSMEKLLDSEVCVRVLRNANQDEDDHIHELLQYLEFAISQRDSGRPVDVESQMDELRP